MTSMTLALIAYTCGIVLGYVMGRSARAEEERDRRARER